MSKRALLRLATSICLVTSLLFLGGITALAEETKPIHEYNFFNDEKASALDTGSSTHYSGYCSSGMQFVPGFNGVGRACHFDGHTNILFPKSALPEGAKSIRIRMKKDPMTVTGQPEPIVADINRFGEGFYIGIGKFGNNTIPGSLYILNQDTKTIYYEIQTTMNICDGKWHDILLTWDGTINANSIKLYIDDMTKPVSQVTPNGIGKSPQDFYAGSCMYEPVDFPPRGFIGDLDLLQIYDSAITINSTTPGGTTIPGDTAGKQNLLVITMVTGERKEYEMTADKINDFLAWYNSKAASSPTYVIEKDYNKASFTARKDYIAYDQISNFEVNEYNN